MRIRRAAYAALLLPLVLAGCTSASEGESTTTASATSAQPSASSASEEPTEAATSEDAGGEESSASPTESDEPLTLSDFPLQTIFGEPLPIQPVGAEGPIAHLTVEGITLGQECIEFDGIDLGGGQFILVNVGLSTTEEWDTSKYGTFSLTSQEFHVFAGEEELVGLDQQAASECWASDMVDLGPGEAIQSFVALAVPEGTTAIAITPRVLGGETGWSWMLGSGD